MDMMGIIGIMGIISLDFFFALTLATPCVSCAFILT
jgi:hypothetical protein